MNNLKPLLPLLLPAMLMAVLSTASAQQAPPKDDPLLNIYRETAPRINDLVHTRLDLHFDYKKCYMYGKEWVTLKPHFYPTDSLRLDAKGMDLKNISIVKNGKNVPLKFTYADSMTVAIKLDKVYHNNEKYTIYIDYTSKPNELKLKGSAAINAAKGLYFVNPDGKEKNKPTQIWTQGETESSSAWFPTIDKTEQKTTDEITMTVPAKYVTLSNGRLASQKKNADGTRTDTWKMELPHSPYLFMIAVGDFKIYHDKWRNKNVDYYVEPKYFASAKETYGLTPEMIDYFSKILGVDYPWSGYSQITVRDYVSGAMENTTATVNGDFLNVTKRQLLDAYYNFGAGTIPHELFHQWFGNYVTAESWSNLTLNESFADFSEALWAEHKYGADEGDNHSRQAMQSYLGQAGNATKPLVRFHYADKEDMFDGISYQKGGRVLNMLRAYLGDAAFFKGLNIYLKTNAFKAAEAQQLRLALEEASGRDLNWFFNEWYYGVGHPVLDITYKWDDASKTETVYLKQNQDGQLFKMPLDIDVYADGKKERHRVWMSNKADTFSFRATSKPNLVNVDAGKKLLAEKTDNKTLEEYTFQYTNAPLYMDRYEAIEAAKDKQSDKDAKKIMIGALKDKYYGLRVNAIQALDLKDDEIRNAAIPVLTSIAQNDKNTLSRATALNALATLKIPGNMSLFKQALTSQSYAVEGGALSGIAELDPPQALQIAKGFEKENADGDYTQTLITLYANKGTADQWPFVYNQFMDAGLASNAQFAVMPDFATFAGNVNSATCAQQGIAALKDVGIEVRKQGFGGVFVKKQLKRIQDRRAELKDDASAKAAEEAIQAITNFKK